MVPMTVFAKGAHYALEDLAKTDYDVVGLDWTMDPADAVRRTGGCVTLQGACVPYRDYSVGRMNERFPDLCVEMTECGSLSWLSGQRTRLAPYKRRHSSVGRLGANSSSVYF